ncbi:MAG: hypothetical protein FJW40_00665 [Acidobacteria bacterium]|nr:hypothetical protein [Acidobacteriota bacterium]
MTFLKTFLIGAALAVAPALSQESGLTRDEARMLAREQRRARLQLKRETERESRVTRQRNHQLRHERQRHEGRAARARRHHRQSTPR